MQSTYRAVGNRNVQLSKKLSYLLRHGAAEYRLNMREDGYVKVSEILSLPMIKKEGFTLEEIRDVVCTNDKQVRASDIFARYYISSASQSIIFIYILKYF